MQVTFINIAVEMSGKSDEVRIIYMLLACHWQVMGGIYSAFPAIFRVHG